MMVCMNVCVCVCMCPDECPELGAERRGFYDILN